MGSLIHRLHQLWNTITGLKATKFVLEKALKSAVIVRYQNIPFGTFRSWYMKKCWKANKNSNAKWRIITVVM